MWICQLTQLLLVNQIKTKIIACSCFTVAPAHATWSAHCRNRILRKPSVATLSSFFSFVHCTSYFFLSSNANCESKHWMSIFAYIVKHITTFFCFCFRNTRIEHNCENDVAYAYRKHFISSPWQRWSIRQRKNIVQKKHKMLQNKCDAMKIRVSPSSNINCFQMAENGSSFDCCKTWRSFPVQFVMLRSDELARNETRKINEKRKCKRNN